MHFTDENCIHWKLFDPCSDPSLSNNRLPVRFAYFPSRLIRVYFFITTVICEAPQKFLTRVKLLFSLQQPSRTPRALPRIPLEIKRGFRAAQMLFDSPRDILSNTAPEQQRPPQVLRNWAKSSPGKCFVLPEFFGPSPPERNKPRKLMAQRI